MMMASASPSDGSTPAAAAMRPSVDKTLATIPEILPHGRVFPIQIGGEMFKLSGASLSSDAPSYFSQYFLCQIKTAEENGDEAPASVRTLYIDRDPATFGDIALHLQGYHVTPRDGTHFVRLFADAQFYSLPRLMSQLFDESIFISIGHREFQIPRDLLTLPTNSPNYFSLGFAASFSRPDNAFPGVDRDGYIRPPAIRPPSVPNRSADTFAALLRLLRGYPVEIRDEAHRQELLRDARYFHFKGLEQQLIPHSITYNLMRQRDEIVLRLENVQKSGVSIVREGDGEQQQQQHQNPQHQQNHQQHQNPQQHQHQNSTSTFAAWVNYARPYVDDRPAELVLEIGGETTKIHFSPDGPRAEFFRDTRARVAKLLEVIATKLSLPPTTQPLGLLMATGGATSQPATPGNTPLSDDWVRVAVGPDAAVVVDGAPLLMDAAESAAGGGQEQASCKRRRVADDASGDEAWWIVRNGQWRLRIQARSGGKGGVECVLVAVCLDAVSSELERNRARTFLGS